MCSYILIVDDDPSVLRGVATLLQQSGFAIGCAATGEQALELLEQKKPAPALVVLDLMLPGMDGYTVCVHIRQRAHYIPILMLSARDEMTDKVIGLDLGADDYVTKPFEPCELLARVRAMLRFANQCGFGEALGEQPIVRGSLRLWRAQHRVEVAERTVELTPKEWTLLELFMTYPEQVFGRETLLCSVWGDDFPGDTRTVDVHVQRLRAKIEFDPAASRYIQTVRGFGYRFVLTDGT